MQIDKKWFKEKYSELEKSLKKLSRGYIVLSLGVIVFVLLHFIIPLETTRAISDNFNKIAIGGAAIITAYFGSSYFKEELTRKKSIEYYKRKYPHTEYGKKFKIIASNENPGAVYLHDLESLHKHHIWNYKTMFDLGWQVYDIDLLQKNDFLSILVGDSIRTRGELGE